MDNHHFSRVVHGSWKLRPDTTHADERLLVGGAAWFLPLCGVAVFLLLLVVLLLLHWVEPRFSCLLLGGTAWSPPPLGKPKPSSTQLKRGEKNSSTQRRGDSTAQKERGNATPPKEVRNQPAPPKRIGKAATPNRREEGKQHHPKGPPRRPDHPLGRKQHHKKTPPCSMMPRF